jgi:hypothetical protein
MAPLWVSLIMALLGLVLCAGVAILFLLRTSDVHAYWMEELRIRPPHHFIFGPVRYSPNQIYLSIIFLGAVAALGALVLVYTILGMLLALRGIDFRITW